MARPKQLNHRHYVRFDDEAQAALDHVAPILEIQPAVLLRMACEMIIKPLATLPEKEMRDAWFQKTNE